MSQKIPIATIGLGLMGSSIATCILAAGHEVTSLDKNMEKAAEARTHIKFFLQQLKTEGLLKEEPEDVIGRLIITDDYSAFQRHEVVIESIIEDIDQKKDVYRKLEAVLSPTAVIGSNTSAIPVSILQQDLNHPERLLGIHWAEPAHVTRFMEVICGDQTDIKYAQKIVSLADHWGKEPSLLRKDIRGFIANRIMYAMLREAFYLVEKGYATVEDVDRSLRNDLGSWITFAGPFRFMDLTGIPAYLTVMKELFGELDNSNKVPAMMQEMVRSGAKGVSNAKGFYPYTPDSAEKWEKSFVEFSYDIRKLSEKYPQKMQARKQK